MVAELDILGKLADLSPAARREARARLDFLDNPGGAEIVDHTGEEAASQDYHLVADEIGKVLGRRIPAPVYLKGRNAKLFKAAAARILDFIRTELEPPRKLEEIRYLRYFLRLMAGDLAKRGRAVCPLTLLRACEDVTQVVDRHFPGYLAGGMLKIILASGRTPSVDA